MLSLMLPAMDSLPAVEVHLEHSLVSLSKWEQIYKKPFFSKNELTTEEFDAYVTMMVVSNPIPEFFEARLTADHQNSVRNYINDPHTATTFREDPNQPKSSEIITSEIIYYWLVTFNIDFQPVESWHIANLMALVRICSIKQAKPKKMSRQQQLAENKRLNDQRRREMGTSG